MNVNRYQFDTIVPKTKRMITPISRGEEGDIYSDYLFLLENLLYQFHQDYGINSRQAKEILQLVLFDIKGAVEKQEYDCSKWEEDCYQTCADSIETLFLPEKNPALKSNLQLSAPLDDDFFELARKSIIRIHESIEYWTKEGGENGYFDFISSFIQKGNFSSAKFLIENRFLI